MYLFVNLSQRDITIARPWWSEQLAFVDLERNFPGKIYKIFDRFPDIQDIFVCNGPGSFTTLRIGCICLNLIQLWRTWTLKFHSFNKIDLWHYLNDIWFFPSQWYMWIGQQHNIWDCNLLSKEYQKISLDSLSRDIIPWEKVFDFCLDCSINPMYHASIEAKDRIFMNYAWKTIDIHNYLLKNSNQYVQPDYLIEI